MVYKDKDCEMLPQIHQGVINSWKILKRFLTEEEIVVYSNGWNPLSSKPQIRNIKEYHSKKEGGKQGRSPSSFYQQASNQPTSPRIQTFDAIQRQEGENNETTPFPKEIT
ncbi:hypothetical protein O181_079451 [Austropuccinia psidii MF-1]|uniref:Uncharacterized protein n=1 Tax=Austropuccinia psidii MF-1 TaxID=1389203 RepID=A0A9Q3FLW1_9BASI|nr:hypothetical protein [Austropuccinia psidii MF-1]